ncbi:MAG: chorismate synthase [Chloroflexota bacterium]|nr:chorismate synthase [Chloroflexota bacterium]
MSLKFLTAGESHGPALIAILEGLPAGLPLSVKHIDPELARRQRGYGAGARMKIESDTVQIRSGVMDGCTTGAPIALRIENRNHEQWRGEEIPPFTIPRPGHADLTAAIKYGYGDLRPSLERASARETAARVAVGAIFKHFLRQFDIRIGGYVIAIGDINANLNGVDFLSRFERAEKSQVRCPDPESSAAMVAAISAIIKAGDTLGGVIECVALNLPPGLGSHVHWDRRLDSRLGAAILGIQAIKGVEIGPAFANTRLPGTQVHDAIHLHPNSQPATHNSKLPTPNSQLLTRPTNRAGGLEGGITTGQPLLMRAAMKPIATTLTPQATVDLSTGEGAKTQYERSDYCPVPRAVPIIESAAAHTLADALIEKLGGDSLSEMKPRFAALRRARLADLPLDNVPHTWWPE